MSKLYKVTLRDMNGFDRRVVHVWADAPGEAVKGADTTARQFEGSIWPEGRWEFEEMDVRGDCLAITEEDEGGEVHVRIYQALGGVRG